MGRSTLESCSKWLVATLHIARGIGHALASLLHITSRAGDGVAGGKDSGGKSEGGEHEKFERFHNGLLGVHQASHPTAPLVVSNQK